MSARVVYVMGPPGSGMCTVVGAGLAAKEIPHRFVNCAVLAKEEIFENLERDPKTLERFLPQD